MIFHDGDEVDFSGKSDTSVIVDTLYELQEASTTAATAPSIMFTENFITLFNNTSRHLSMKKALRSMFCKTKKHNIDLHLHCAFQRREWDLNPRMSVLQTDALGHLAIPPSRGCGESIYPRHADVKYIFSVLLIFYLQIPKKNVTKPLLLLQTTIIQEPE